VRGKATKRHIPHVRLKKEEGAEAPLKSPTAIAISMFMIISTFVFVFVPPVSATIAIRNAWSAAIVAISVPGDSPATTIGVTNQPHLVDVRGDVSVRGQADRHGRCGSGGERRAAQSGQCECKLKSHLSSPWSVVSARSLEVSR
jgi:hypothetical protein